MGQTEESRNEARKNSEGHRQLRVRRSVGVELVGGGTNARHRKSQLLD
jgi:hypothetical protein